MHGSWLKVVSHSARIIFYLGTFHSSLHSNVDILDCVRQIFDPNVLVWKLMSYMLRRRFLGNEGIPILSDELLGSKFYLTLPHASVN